MKFVILLTLAMSALAGCSTPTVRIMESEWTSMTRSQVPRAQDVQEVGPVEGKFCHSTFKSGHYGLMDEAISQAQKNYHVDYIKNATFMMNKAKACVSVEGIGYKIKTT
ncbi:MAG: hypothetical protein KDD22_06195 [Bdellovibrionales bacterium]|nr:hypothetical protein [Bdellovibrionales bacterium]